MDLGLKGKVGIVTGASRGIGAEIARELGREGCCLLLTGRSTRDLELRAAEVGEGGGRAVLRAIDLTDATSGATLIHAVKKEFGKLDFVVANAGAAKTGDFLNLSDDDWQQGFALKFFGHLRLLREAWPELVSSRGSIVVIAGIAGRTPESSGLVTGAVNAALSSLTKALASRGIKDGVRVNAIHPGPIRTGRFGARLEAISAAQGVSVAEAERRYVEINNVTRVGEPTDIAGLVAFLLSGRGSYVHGALIDVDGGKTKSL